MGFHTMDNLTKGTALSNRLLIEAWDSLSVETKIEIANIHNGMLLQFQEIILKFLEDANPYVRYLAVVGSFGNAKLISEKASGDSSELVREAVNVINSDSDILDWKQASQLKRLISLSTRTHIHLNISSFVEFVKGSVGVIADDDLYDLVKEYCATAYVRRRAETRNEFGSNFMAMWRLVGTVPLGIYSPVTSLYPTELDYNTSVPEDAIERMIDSDLVCLLGRQDALLPMLRKQIEETPDKFDGYVVSAHRYWKKEKESREESK